MVVHKADFASTFQLWSFDTGSRRKLRKFPLESCFGFCIFLPMAFCDLWIQYCTCNMVLRLKLWSFIPPFSSHLIKKGKSRSLLCVCVCLLSKVLVKAGLARKKKWLWRKWKTYFLPRNAVPKWSLDDLSHGLYNNVFCFNSNTIHSCRHIFLILCPSPFPKGVTYCRWFQ